MSVGIVIAAVLILVVASIVWLIGSVQRGARRRDERIAPELAAIHSALEAGAEPAAEEVARAAARPYARPLLYALLRQHDRQLLFPPEYLSQQAQAEGALTYWMMHPNELKDPPEQLEHVSTVTRSILGEDVQFEVFRYRMPAGHWAGQDWILGLGGPFAAGAEPYEAAGWSLADDRADTTAPEAVVDRFIQIVLSKAGRAAPATDAH